MLISSNGTIDTFSCSMQDIKLQLQDPTRGSSIGGCGICI